MLLLVLTGSVIADKVTLHLLGRVVRISHMRYKYCMILAIWYCKFVICEAAESVFLRRYISRMELDVRAA